MNPVQESALFFPHHWIWGKSIGEWEQEKSIKLSNWTNSGESPFNGFVSIPNKTGELAAMQKKIVANQQHTSLNRDLPGLTIMRTRKWKRIEHMMVQHVLLWRKLSALRRPLPVCVYEAQAACDVNHTVSSTTDAAPWGRWYLWPMWTVHSIKQDYWSHLR